MGGVLEGMETMRNEMGNLDEKVDRMDSRIVNLETGARIEAKDRDDHRVEIQRSRARRVFSEYRTEIIVASIVVGGEVVSALIAAGRI